jgi:2,5-furandicarboxylate decarboxylase 1
VHDVVLDGSTLNAATLPISRHFAKDAGRYIGSGVLVCKDPNTGVRNLSYQRTAQRAEPDFTQMIVEIGY